MSIEQILINLPDSYKANIVSQLKVLSTNAIEDSDHQAAIDLLTIVKELTKPEQKESLVSPANAENTSAVKNANAEGEFASRITDEEVERFCGFIKAETKAGIQYTSREINDLLEPAVLGSVDIGLFDTDITLPLQPSRPERPKWKELASRALIQLVQEGYMVRPLNSRYLYLVNDSTTHAAVPEIPQSNVVDESIDDITAKVREGLKKDHPVANLRTSNPFPSFAPIPEKYAPSNDVAIA